jgi:hypothetical protein
VLGSVTDAVNKVPCGKLNGRTGEIALVTVGKLPVNEFKRFRHVTMIISKHVAVHAMVMEAAFHN